MENHVAYPTCCSSFTEANTIATHDQCESRQNNYPDRGRECGTGIG